MDPLTVASKRFQGEVQLFWNPPPGHAPPGPSVLRLGVPPSAHVDVVTSLKVLEWSPQNRRPFLIVEEPCTTMVAYSEACARKVELDYAALRKGLADDGVALPPLAALARPVTLPTLVRALRDIALSVRSALAGLVLVLIPRRVENAASFATVVTALSAAADGEALRLAVLDQPEVQRDYPGIATFDVDEDALLEFLKAMGTDTVKSKGPAVAGAPVLSPAAKRAVEQEIGAPLMSEATGIDLRALLLDAGSAMSKGAFKVALRRFRAARMLCHLAGLRDQEAATSVAAGSAALAARDYGSAIAAYRQGRAIALGCGNKLLAAQAELGLAGVHFSAAEFAKARTSYRELQDLAQDIPAIALEALRMEGECYAAEGRATDAATSFAGVIAAAARLPVEVRNTTSYAHAGKALAGIFTARGDLARAKETDNRVSMLATAPAVEVTA